MKHLKKLAGCLLALVMILTMSNVAVVNAANNNDTNYDTSGSINIDDAVPGQTYSVYQLLYLESYDDTKKAYAYKATDSWENWLETQTDYVRFDNQGYVTWKEGADAAAFAKAALAYAKSEQSGIKTVGQAVAPAATEGQQYSTVTFNNLQPGYYLLDTTLGTLCSLDTAKPNVTIQEKNEVPDVKKEVKEDSTGDFGSENTAQIGDTVEFKTTIHAKPGAQSYVLHDEMSTGLTLNVQSIKVQVNNQDLAEANYNVFTTGLTDNCDFEITFDQSYLDTITANTDIVVIYSAVLNENAETYTVPNTNKTKLNYGDDSDYDTTWKETETYSFSFDIVKTDSDNKLLDGAEFELYDAQTGGNKIPLVKESVATYRVATKAEAETSGFVSAVIQAANGQATVKGFDDNTSYWLEETKAPDGYNKLADRVEVKFEEKVNISTSMTGGTWENGDGGVHIVNNTGSLIPSTGGMGTTVLYMAGGILVIAAGALLIFRRRMHTDR